MQHTFKVLALLALTLPLTPATAEEIKGTSRIDRVIVFPAGAEVSRIARLKLAPGEHTVLLDDLPAQAVQGSIRVEGKSTGARLDIGSVDTRRTSIAREDEAAATAERKRIEAEIERLLDQRAALQTLIATAETQKSLVTNLTELPRRPAPAQGPGQVTRAEDWSQLLGLIGTSMTDVHRTILETQVKLRELDRRVDTLRKQLASVAPPRLERTEVKVFVSATAPLEADLTVRYQVPGAAWTPLYDARLATGSKAAMPKLALTRRATITQRTGEAWENVSLALSTTRPAAGTAAPELATVTIDFVPEPKPAPVAAAPAAPARLAVSRGREADGLARLESQKVAEAAPETPQDAVEVGSGITQGAFQAVFAVPGRLTVPETGEAKRVLLDEVTLDPTLSIRAVPKHDERAFLYAKLTLPKTAPYLPGVVSLFRDGTYVGTGRMPLLGPGSEHELGFGSDDSVRVRYAVADEKRGETGIISSSRTDQRNYKISIKNLHERAIGVVVMDQVPASQNQDIKVEITGRTPPTRRDVDDKRGVLAWEASLQPDEERVIEFGYRVTWPAAKAIQYGR